ncbi:serine hydrolase domain-containing protein [Pelagovum pacificum]|uniref:Serine hydrolase n=1 Tax=Pelagovum pacificum TaxID=2588711 RepID=A0A5C5GI26_9RHOB|nr:serine hydrolase [Pelagovum pacificum]QQA42619.1 serine hydrolase [Pelagovum pacificum]TNY34230.1 serine hydrolase [Pelagovum pacificum]
MVLIRALLLLLAFAGSAAADVGAIQSAWQTWATQNGVRSSSIAISRNGDVLARYGLGRGADDPAPLASLSKSITGACVMRLVDAGRLSTGSTVGQVLGGRFQMTPGASQITVAELLTHTSGINRDVTQGRPSPWRARGGDRTPEVTASALSRPPGPKGFAYNNENYAVLGSMIETVTGQNSASYCPRTLGINANVSSDFGGGVSWGGYEMSAADFTRFASTLRPQGNWPRAEMGGGIVYGPGVMMKDGRDGTTLWHFGSWCFLLGRSAGAYFFQLPNSWGVTVTYDRCLSSNQTLALDAALTAAIR